MSAKLQHAFERNSYNWYPSRVKIGLFRLSVPSFLSPSYQSQRFQDSEICTPQATLFLPTHPFLSQVYAEVVFVQQQLSGQWMEEALKIVEANRSVGHGTTLLSQLQLQVRVVALVVEPLYRCKGTLEVAVLPCFSQDFRPFVTWKWGKMWIIVRAKITWSLKYGVFARVFFPVLFGDVFG